MLWNKPQDPPRISVSYMVLSHGLWAWGDPVQRNDPDDSSEVDAEEAYYKE